MAAPTRRTAATAVRTTRSRAHVRRSSATIGPILTPRRVPARLAAMSAAEPALPAVEPAASAIEPTDRLLRWLPSPAALVAIVIGTVLVLTTLFHGLTDVDYFWHVTTGRLIATGGIPNADPFSFTYAGGAWTPH